MVSEYGKSANFSNSSSQTPKIDSGATTSTRFTLPYWYIQPATAILTIVLPVPISIKSAAPRLLSRLSNTPNLSQAKAKAFFWWSYGVALIDIISSIFSIIALTPHFLDFNALHAFTGCQHKYFTKLSEKKGKQSLRNVSVFALQDFLLMSVTVCNIDFYFVF